MHKLIFTCTHSHPSQIVWVLGTSTLSRVFSPYLHPPSVGDADAPAVRVHAARCNPQWTRGEEMPTRSHMHTRGSLLATPSCPLPSRCRILMASQGRMLNLAWAGQWCHGTTSGSMKPDFYCFSISFCLSLTHYSSLLWKKKKNLFIHFFKLIFFPQSPFAIKTGNDHLSF